MPFQSKLLQPKTLESLICHRETAPPAQASPDPEISLEAYLDILDVAIEGIRHHVPRHPIGA